MTIILRDQQCDTWGDGVPADIQDMRRQEARYDVAAARHNEQAARNELRPCMQLLPTLKHVEPLGQANYWTATFYDVVATGETPDEAYTNFDNVWRGTNDPA